MKYGQRIRVPWVIGCIAAHGACVESSPEDQHLNVADLAIGAEVQTTYNVHLEEAVRFTPVQPGADPVRGRARFGLAADMVSEDKAQAIFEGSSVAFGGVVVSNQRTCFTCHRGQSTWMGLPPPPLSATIDPGDALFTGIGADAPGDPDAMFNLDQLGLIKYRPNRFNPTRSQDDPFRQVFFWRKSIALLNVGFTHGFLNDARARTMFETAQGAIFSHTQDSDNRFDDLFSVEDGNDLEAFLFDQLTDPRLAALRDPSDPMYEVLVKDPFYTVPIETAAQNRGKDVFRRYCMPCHNTPNVFGNVSNVEALGNGERDVTAPPFAPSVARTFNIGVAERNRHNLRFTRNLGNGDFEPIILPLANEDGTITNLTVTFDVGLAATTARMQDVGRFKVPQLRELRHRAPYFHDNSASTIEEVVDYFNSDYYNQSADGRRYPIHLGHQQRSDLIELLQIL